MPKKIKDYTGQKFGKLTALEYVGYKQGNALWKCRCDCGTICVRNKYHLTTSKTPSCGCAKEHAGRSGKKKELPAVVEVVVPVTQYIPEIDTRDRWQKRRDMAAAYRRRIGMEGAGKQDAEKYCAAKAGGHGMEWHEGV